MGVRVGVALFDSATGTAFGPSFEDEEEATLFLQYATEHEPRDLRELSDEALLSLYRTWADSL